jgi:hypothetical protein
MEMASIAIVFVLGLFGGFAGTGGDTGAPRDTAQEAARYVLPDASVAAHFDVGGTMAAVDKVMAELEDLELNKRSATFGRTLGQLRSGIEMVAKGVSTEAGIDPRKQVGSLTFSLTAVSENDIRFLVRLRGDLTGLKLDALTGGEGKATVSRDYKGIALRALPETGSLKDHVLAQVDETTLVLGARELVQDVIAKKAWKGTERSASTRITAGVGDDAQSFLYLAPTDWMRQDLAKNPRDREVSVIFDGVDYALYVASPTSARGLLATRNPVFAGRMHHVAQAVAGVVSMIGPMTEALGHGAVGVLPWAARRKAADTADSLESDSRAVGEAAAWATKTFGGTAKASLDDGVVSLELSNPRSLSAIVLPGMGAALFGFSALMPAPTPVMIEEPMEDPDL